MSAFVWTVTIANTAVTLMALALLVTDETVKQRRTRAIAVAVQGGLAIWGYAVLGVFS